MKRWVRKARIHFSATMEPSRCWFVVLCVYLSIGIITRTESSQFSSYYNLHHQPDKDYVVCTSKPCNNTAKELLSGMDFTYEPCRHFYEYVCFNWHGFGDFNPGPEINQFKILQDKFVKSVKGMLQSKKKEGLPADVVLAKKLYKACMDVEDDESAKDLTREYNNKQASRLLQMVNDAGGWPLINPSWEETPTSFVNTELFYIRNYSTSMTYELSLMETPASTYKIRLGTAKPVMPSFISKEDPLWKDAYRHFMRRTVQFLVGTNKYQELHNNARFAKDLIDMIELEERIADAADPKKNIQCISPNVPAGDLWNRSLRNLPQFQQEKDMPGWLRLLKFMSPNEMVEGWCTRYEAMIKRILSETPQRTLVNYVHWRMVARIVPKLSERVTAIYARDQKPRDQKCMEENEALPAVIHYLAQLKVSEEDDERVKEMYEVIDSRATSLFLSKKPKMKKLLLRMSAYSRHNNMKIFFEEPWDEFYQKRDLKTQFPNNGSELYVDNLLSVIKNKPQVILNHRKDHGKISMPNVNLTNAMMQLNADPFYVSGERYIPAGLFQLPFYKKGRSQTLNYATFGVLLAQSIMKEYYDNLIYHYKSTGGNTNLYVNKLIREEAGIFYNEWRKWVYDLNNWFNASSIPSHLDDIYDVMAARDAVRIAFDSYKKQAALKKHKDLRLPGMEEFNQDQLFFIAYANMHCEIFERKSVSPRDKFYSIERDREFNSRTRQKIRLGLMNNEHFRKAFQC